MTPYDPRSSEAVREPADDTLRTLLDNPALNDVDVLGALIEAYSTTLAEQQEQTLSAIDDDAFLQTATGDALDRKVREYGIQRRSAVPATGVVTFDHGSTASTDISIPKFTRVSTADNSVTFETTEAVTISAGTQTTTATVRATRGGADTNVGANTLTQLPNLVAGVNSVTNTNPVGDESFTDTDGDQLVPGRDTETDAELRQRAIDATAIGGAATVSAVETALVDDIPGVRSVTVLPNPTASTNGNGFGLPPYSNEIIVSGGAEDAIARSLVNVVSITELFRLQAGVVGTGVTRSVFVSALDGTVDVAFSRPNNVSLSITLSLKPGATYAGDSDVADSLVQYVGGTLSDGSTTTGLGAGEDVLIDRLRNAVVGTANDVNALGTMTVDTDDDGSDDRTTDVNNIERIPIANSDQARLDASNVSVTQL